MGNITQKEKNQALIDAIEKDDLEGAGRALELGADPNALDNDLDGNKLDMAFLGGTIMMVACLYGNVEIIRLLLDYGADIHAVNSTMKTPLHNAAFQGDIETVKILIEAGADVNAVDKDGKTPLMYVCSDMDGHGEVVEMVSNLIKAGADVNIINDYGTTALHYAMEGDSISVIKMLIKAGADVNAGTDIRWTPLMWGAYVGFIEGMVLLVDAGADVNLKNKNGKTAFEILKYYFPDMYARLINKYALKYEDSAGTADQCPSPDFDI